MTQSLCQSCGLLFNGKMINQQLLNTNNKKILGTIKFSDRNKSRWGALYMFTEEQQKKASMRGCHEQ